MNRERPGNTGLSFFKGRKEIRVIANMKVHSIVIDKLNKKFGGQRVLKDVSLSIDAGEYVGLIGINGAGKTTLIKCILDFCAVDSGSINLSGIDHRQTGSRNQLTYLPEKFIPPYYLTGENFLKYMADLNGTAYDAKAVTEMLSILDLDNSALIKPVRQYSKGMGQKLGLAACMLSDKALMVFDEPMSGLDPKARALLKRHLLKLKKQGKTLFYSTHLLEDVAALCDRVIILHDGMVCFFGTTQECCEKYQVDNFEAAYLKCVEG